MMFQGFFSKLVKIIGFSMFWEVFSVCYIFSWDHLLKNEAEILTHTGFLYLHIEVMTFPDSSCTTVTHAHFSYLIKYHAHFFSSPLQGFLRVVFP